MSASILTTNLGAAVERAARGHHCGERLAAAVVLGMEGVHKSFVAGARECRASVRVLNGASLSVSAGEIVGVAGGEGAGKSTLLLCAAGVVQPDRGRVRWPVRVTNEGARPLQPLYLDLRGDTARSEIEGALEAGARLILVDHAAPALLPELRAILARSRPGCHGAFRQGAMVVASRQRAWLARVASRVLVLREGRLHASVVGSAPRPAPHAEHHERQRNRPAARASASSPAAFARARMRST